MRWISEAVTKLPNGEFLLAVWALAPVNSGATVANAKTANKVTAAPRKNVKTHFRGAKGDCLRLAGFPDTSHEHDTPR